MRLVWKTDDPNDEREFLVCTSEDLGGWIKNERRSYRHRLADFVLSQMDACRKAQGKDKRNA